MLRKNSVSTTASAKRDILGDDFKKLIKTPNLRFFSNNATASGLNELMLLAGKLLE